MVEVEAVVVVVVVVEVVVPRRNVSPRLLRTYLLACAGFPLALLLQNCRTAGGQPAQERAAISREREQQKSIWGLDGLVQWQQGRPLSPPDELENTTTSFVLFHLDPWPFFPCSVFPPGVLVSFLSGFSPARLPSSSSRSTCIDPPSPPGRCCVC